MYPGVDGAIGGERLVSAKKVVMRWDDRAALEAP